MKRILCALLLLLPTATLADFLEDGQRALNAGNYKQALNDLNKYLDRNPDNAEARFGKGLALVMLKQDDEAIRVFSDLVRDFPELPEPYNNLAVLYARSGRYEEARDALESALVTHPSYATAHENLGDIYAALANAAYNRAIVLDKNNAAVRSKQEMVAQLINLEGSSVPPVQVAASAPRAAVPAKPAAAAVAASQPKPAAAATAPAAVADAYDIPSTFSTEPVLPGGAGRSSGPQLAKTDEQAVLARLDSWRMAWSAQDPDAYLANYSANFQPASGLSRSAWESQRRTRVVRPRSIQIQVLQPKLSAESDGRIKVEFTQIYESNTYSDQVRKRLILEKSGAQWLIVKEAVIG